MTPAAQAEEAHLVVNHLELVRLLDPAAQASQRVVRDRAARHLLDPPAALANQVGVMPGELLAQLVPKAAAGGVHGPHQSRRDQQVDGPVHGDAVDALRGHSGMKLFDGERVLAGSERL